MNEENDFRNLKLYEEHAGTIKVAGSTIPRRASHCALCFIKKGTLPVDFMCIGANANQQATKAMGIFCYVMMRNEEQDIEVAFQPLLFRTETVDPVTGQIKLKSVTVWRTILMERKPSKI